MVPREPGVLAETEPHVVAGSNAMTCKAEHIDLRTRSLFAALTEDCATCNAQHDIRMRNQPRRYVPVVRTHAHIENAVLASESPLGDGMVAYRQVAPAFHRYVKQENEATSTRTRIVQRESALVNCDA